MESKNWDWVTKRFNKKLQTDLEIQTIQNINRDLAYKMSHLIVCKSYDSCVGFLESRAVFTYMS